MAETNDPAFFGENRSLFSDYYLAERLSDHKDWSEDVSAPFQRALEIYRENKALLPEMKEAQTEKEFIQPILSDVLGFEYDVQRSEKRSGRVNIPDYILFGNRSALKEAQAHRNEPGKYYSDALALSDAKYWERPLDGTGVAERDWLTNANPSFQIVSYLTATGLDWGILTNGSQWRLYSMKSRSRIDSYFEVNLKRILEEENEEQFKYFYHFFRAGAFREDPETGQHFLGSVFDGSIDYGTRLEGRLKELIFEDVFLILARGFTEFRADEARNEAETDQSLREIYQGTLRMLYRLLFLLHAESRSLLPIENKDYFQYSLMKLKKDIAERVGKGLTPSNQSFDVWNDLDSLFRIIDKGDPDLNVPRYNGGLFRGDHPKNRFLSGHKISDKYLVPALELLTREPDPQTGRKRFIDYKSLNVEQLGSIYEGLLEFHLRIAGEPLAIVKEKGREVYKPQSEVKNPSAVLEQGELYLENDKGERKATGSYYTPHYIVEYIVEHTLGPVFNKRAETFEGLMERLEPKYRQYKKLDRKITEGDHSERTHNKRKGLHLQIESLEHRATDALLSLKICDPAMGSGHFLKEATDKLAEKMITLLAKFPENPVTKLLGTIREEILQSLDKQDITIDAEEHLKDTNLIKRMVMKRSIYGVDLNPMAVELAKLSLWLDSFTVGAPLSFLDHHLKTGNSLIGTTVKEVKDALTSDTLTEHGLAGQLFQGGPFVGMLKATGFMHEVAIQTDATIAEIEKSVNNFSEYEDAITPYKQILDLWVSQHFENERAQDLVRSYGEDVIDFIKGNRKPKDDAQKKIFDEAQSISSSKSLFHWELEFPEVFIDLKQSKWLENPGFDAVVGNPPYLDIKGMESEIKNYLVNNYDFSKMRINIFASFIERSLTNLKAGFSNLGYIVPTSFLTQVSYSKLRKVILENDWLNSIVRMPNELFGESAGDVKVDTCIVVIQKKKRPNKKTDILIYDSFARIDEISEETTTTYFELNQKRWKNSQDYIIGLAKQEVFSIIEKIKNDSIHLEELCEVSLGITPYDKYAGHSREQIENQVFHEKEELDDNYKKLLKSGDVRRYSVKWNGEDWLRYGEWLAAPREEKFFTKERILVQQIIDWSSLRILAGLTDEELYNTQNQFNFIAKNNTDLRFILAIFNSKLLAFFHRQVFLDISLQRFQKILIKDAKTFPIREIDFSKFDAEKNAEFPNRLERLYHSYLEGQSEAGELLVLTERLSNEDDEYRLPVIHDFLAFLAEQMLDFNKEKQRLQSALDPFKFLNKGVGFKPFASVFSEAIKYGRQLTDGIDIGTVHHDIEGLRLQPEGDKWLLKLQLKHRDPETGWSDWVKEDGNIVRSMQPIYRFELPEQEAHYWQQAFEVLEEFENNSTFPGGKTRSTFEKLMKTKVPMFDDSANIDPLIELREELAEVEEKIEKTDGLIDQVVYQLYGLSEEEIAVVEGEL